jgi:hypothetical protein
VGEVLGLVRGGRVVMSERRLEAVAVCDGDICEEAPLCCCASEEEEEVLVVVEVVVAAVGELTVNARRPLPLPLLLPPLLPARRTIGLLPPALGLEWEGEGGRGEVVSLLVPGAGGAGPIRRCECKGE